MMLERFWSKADDSGECWLWIGRMINGGYGAFTSRHGRHCMAHRVAWELANAEEIPAGLYVDHMCRNRRCVNPDHLRVVTPRVNATENNVGPSAANAARTHCVNGHEFTLENTYVHGPGWRKCRTCLAARRRRYRSKEKV